MIRRFARPYAKAIMEVAGSPDKAHALRGELTRFEAARKQSQELQELYPNPGIDNDAKIKVTRAIASRLGLSEMANKVLEVLIRNRRINDLQSVVEAVAELVRAATGTVAAQVRSAHRLNEQEVAELRRALEKKVGRKVELEVSTDPRLIGGFVARMGSEVYDASVVGKIDKFRESLD
jgi:F-type H+-transporting ATPase subunit delta